VFASRLKGVPGSVALGSIAGLAFGGAAIDSRTLAGMHSLHAAIAHPLLYLLGAHALVGQLLLGMALQRGSTTAAVAAMDAAATAPAAIIGLVMLGDQIWPGRQWLAAAGFVCTLVAVLGLSRFARPQHHPGPRAAGSAVPAQASPHGAAPAQEPRPPHVPAQAPWPSAVAAGAPLPATAVAPGRGGYPPERGRPRAAGTPI
jgi:hypothetical protein